MKIRSWPFLLLGFSVLLSLLGISAAALQHRAEDVRDDVEALQLSSHEASRVLESLRSEIYLGAVLMRDYLMERSPGAASQQRQALEELQISTSGHVRELRSQPGLKDRPEVAQLSLAIEQYWRQFAPVFEWTPKQKAAEGLAFLRRDVSPMRQTAFDLAAEIESISREQTRVRQLEILRTQEALQAFLRNITILMLLFGSLVAAASILRTRSLELSSARHVRQIEHANEDLRRLSSRLAKAQEDERRTLSRELHDQIGQMLTALRIELGNIGETRNETGAAFDRHLADARKLAEETLRSIRDISMGLRPSMLDELGLGPALKWQAREFMRRSAVPVDTQIDGHLDDLPEAHRTCIYRVVQEALTNCARHAQASRIRVTIHGGAHTVALTVEDDGVGFDTGVARANGLGLMGAEERVRELGGQFEIISGPSKGTLLHCEIPTPEGTMA